MLTPLQIELLKTFSRPLDEHQLQEIRQLLANYFAQKVDDSVDALFIEKEWNSDIIEGWLTDHDRTPYDHNWCV